MTTDTMIHHKKKRTPPPSVLLLAIPSETTNYGKNSHYHHRLIRREATLPPTRTVQHKRNLDVENYLSTVQTYNWQRHEAKASVINMAVDIVYKNTYMTENGPHSKSSSSSTGDRSSRRNNDASTLPRLKTAPNDFLQCLSPLSKPTPVLTRTNTSDSFHSNHSQYRTVYDYIRDSIRSVVQQRNLKQQNFSTKIKRPQNEDIFLRRALDKKNHFQLYNNNSEHSSSTTEAYFHNEMKSPQSFVNYVNHSREKTLPIEQTSKYNYYKSRSFANSDIIEQELIQS
ncbi:unnamed protein product [Didymodactylos carnosus]|uniref:Uncharacterized protein n=1 Tax=Didymodactylos carnosus TaxID=1234261 RepID=A0A813STU1_9BILA|nr:unnamed protein product [Didymodactylos carnosus]CAF0826587.1 unnamed protein product [Didymodactylos carnosus]CAF3585843.1 unnamed protein product [Didymodactylos carnosus]CAF3611060.1 unnamed protein product [Didymodactylos carnosus]